jgi:general secretion pathway protein H
VVTSEHPLVRYLLEELITQRLENARLHADLAAAGGRRAEIEKGAREKETALAAGIAGLHDELAWSEAQLTLPTAAPAVRLLEEARAAEPRARARRQVAAMKTSLKELDRQMAIVQSLAESLGQRLGMVQAELKRRDAENERLTAELDELRMKTQSAPVPAHLSTGPNADPMDVLPERLEQPVGLLYANWIDVSPTVPRPKPRLRASEVEAGALASDASDGGTAAPSRVNVAMDDAAWTQAPLREVVARDREPTTDTVPFSTPESRYVPDTMSTAAPALKPLISRMLAPGEGRLTVLDEATARLADGLRATREDAILEQQERIFAVDVHKRAFGRSAAETLPLDRALNISLLTAKSELIGESTGGIRFFPDGSSTGGRIELELLGDRAAINIRWSTGAVTLER